MKIYAVIGSAPVHYGAIAMEGQTREVLVSFADQHRSSLADLVERILDKRHENLCSGGGLPVVAK